MIYYGTYLVLFMKIKLLRANYKSIMDELIITENEYFYISRAYVENGSVVIQGTIRAKVPGYKIVKIIPEKYAPRITIYATIGYPSSGTDIGKIAQVRFNEAGELSFWVINGLDYGEPFSIVYPLRSS